VKETDHSEDLGIDRRIEMNVKKWCVGVEWILLSEDRVH
jgi:hypothetical protein